MVWKKLTNYGSSPGDATHYGGDDMGKVSGLLNGDTTIDSVTIDSNFTFKTTRFRLRDSDNSHSHIFATPNVSEDKTINIPQLTGTSDTMVMEAKAATLTGKTITFDDNTLTNVVSTNTAQTLTGPKTLTSPIISTIVNTGTLTLPTSTDTLMGRATTDIITNKTIDAASNTLNNMPLHPDKKLFGQWMSLGGTQSTGVFQGNTAATGTPVTSNTAALGRYSTLTTAATSGSDGGLRVDDARGNVIRAKAPRGKFKFRHVTSGTAGAFRLFAGWANTQALLTGDDPLTSLHGVMVCARSTDTNFQIAHNSAGGAGTTTFVDTGVSKTDGIAHTFEVKADTGDTGFTWSFDGAAFQGSPVTSNVPTSGIGLSSFMQIETSAAEAKGIDIWYMYLEANP